MPDAPSPLNLVSDPWLPVRRRSGEVAWIAPSGITDAIDDDPVVAFAWARPDFNGAALEFLIGLLSTANAPANDREWHDWWVEPPEPDALATTFDRFTNAFYLDGEEPRFLQDLDPLDGADQKDIGSLLIDAPGAQTLRNNADLFVKRGGVPVLSRGAAAMALFVLNAFAPSGGAGHRTSLRGGGPMSTLVVPNHQRLGDTLWTRLWANVETLEQIALRAPGRNEADTGVFPWTVRTRTSNPKAEGRSTTPVDVHPLQVYWGMPRRIRLQFEEGAGRPCAVTGTYDKVVAVAYRTRNYGTNYSEGFEHPLTPYYRQRAGSAKLPVHPQPGGISYRLWPGMVAESADGLREPASTVRRWKGQGNRWRLVRPEGELRLSAFGYDMDNMKARAWVEGEMPLWTFDDAEAAKAGEKFAGHVVACTETIGRLLIRAIKSARHERPQDASGDYGFVSERLYRVTEQAFYEAINEAVSGIKSASDPDDPTLEARTRWPNTVARSALALFDEYVPSDGLEARNMERHVKARFDLSSALRGYGRGGKALERDLNVRLQPAKGQRSNKGTVS